MALKFTLKTERIEFSGDDYIDVRGLGLSDITQLVHTHKEAAVEIYNKFTGRDENSFTDDDVMTLADDLASTFPTVVTHTIALAADVPDQFNQVSRLPIDVQTAALEKIFALTFAMSGGAKKFVETVTRIAKGANGLKEKSQTPHLT